MYRILIRSAKLTRNYHRQGLRSNFCHTKTIIPSKILYWKPIVSSRRQLSTSCSLYSIVRDDFDTDNADEPYDIEVLETDQFLSLKTILYPNSNDPAIAEITDCATIDNVIKAINKHEETSENDKNWQKCVQTILVVCDILRTINPEESKLQLRKLRQNKAFIEMLQNLKNRVCEMTPDELTCAFLYLSRSGYGMEHETMNAILKECLKRIAEEMEDFPLTALSRFIVTVNASRQFYTFFICQDAFPRIVKALKINNSHEELRLLTICLSQLSNLVSSDVLNLYKEQIERLIDVKEITPDTIKCILKIISFLNLPHWSQKNTNIIRKLSLMLKPNIATFHSRELDTLFKVFQSQMEPAAIVPDLTSHSELLLEKSPTANLLACAVMYALPNKRLIMTEYANELLKSSDLTGNVSLPALFKVLRSLKISNTAICNSYWSRVVEEIQTNPMEQEPYRIVRYCHRYMHFNNNLGGTYRHIAFEKMLTNLLMGELTNGISAVVPARFSKIVGFIMAYGHVQKVKHKFPEIILERIEAMQEQFSPMDCLMISRGLQIAHELRYRYFVPPDLAQQITHIDMLLNNCAERHIANPELSLIDLNFVTRAYNNRKSSRKTDLFQRIVSKYDEMEDNLTSRLIREITYNLNGSSHLSPNMCKRIIDYVVNNHEFVTGDTIEKVLCCCYNLGYFPENEEFFGIASHIIDRDFEYMTGLSIIQGCLALAFLKALPKSLIHRVFNIHFIKRLEDEIQNCYSKATYPERVLNQVMQLNRAVCLDYPEAEVPWFQQNYLEAQMTKQPTVVSHFHMDIRRILVSIVGEDRLLRPDHITPYGYKIDFVLHMDNNKKFLPPPQDDVIHKINKIAVLLLKLEAFCENTDILRGQEFIRKRHLEMLGYKVIHINYSEWQSMYMSIPGAKIDYLKNLLQLTS